MQIKEKKNSQEKMFLFMIKIDLFTNKKKTHSEIIQELVII